MSFLTRPSGGAPTEAARFTSSGNLRFPSGQGIDFSATANSSGTMTSELLSDYEEGTWTPNIGGNATYTTQEGIYVKIGNHVFCTMRLRINSIGTGSSTTVSGLPFTPSQGTSMNAGGSVSYFINSATNATWLGIQISTNVATFLIVGTTTASSAIVNGLSFFQNSAEIIISFFYKT